MTANRSFQGIISGCHFRASFQGVISAVKKIRWVGWLGVGVGGGWGWGGGRGGGGGRIGPP